MIKYYFDFKGVAFVPFRDIYPECNILIGTEPQLYPLKCMASSCPKNANCATKLAHRVNFFFDKVAVESPMLLAYFKYQDKEGSIRAGIFHRDLREPRVILCNRSAFRKMQREGTVYSWDQPDSFYSLGNT